MVAQVKTNNKGFTLIEAILANIILCGAVLAVSAISTRSLSETRLNRQYEVAASLIDKQLCLIDYTGIDQFVELGRMEGVVEQFEPGYHWEVTAAEQDIDNLYLLNITVTWVERSRLRRLSVDTMLDGTGMIVDIEQE